MSQAIEKKASRRRTSKPAAQRTDDPGVILQRLRKEREISLERLAAMSGVSAATISRIENHRISPTFSVLSRLGEALGLRWSDIVGPSTSSFAPGCRAVDRANGGPKQRMSQGVYEWLGSDLVSKDMSVTLIDLAADPGGDPNIAGHTGQEVIYVLEGSVVFYMEFYAPLTLATGDSVYFDANTPHAVYAKVLPSRILSVVSRGAI